MTPVLRTTGAFAINPPSPPQAAAPGSGSSAGPSGPATEPSPAGLDSLLDALLGDGITSARFGQACQLMARSGADRSRRSGTGWLILLPDKGTAPLPLSFAALRPVQIQTSRSSGNICKRCTAGRGRTIKQERWRLMVADLLEQLIPDRHCSW